MPAKNVRKPPAKSSAKSSSMAASSGPRGSAAAGSKGKRYNKNDDDEYASSSGSEDQPFGKGARNNSSDEEEDEEEVFNLAGSDDEDEESDDASDDDEEEEGSDEESDDEDASETELDQLVRNLPADMRRRVLQKKGAQEEEDSDSDLVGGSDEDDDEEEEGWGKKKKMYWNGDTADLEIGQDIQDAEDEEEAARELGRQQKSKLRDEDFFEDFKGSKKDKSNATKNAKGNDRSTRTDKLQKALELAASGGASYEGKSVEVENIPRNIDQLSKEERMALLQVESRELPALAAELSERVNELKEKINPVKQLVKQVVASNPEGVNDELVQYLEVKQQLLLSYCTNLVFYMLLKSQGKSVRNHPVMRQLLDLRYVMEKLRSLDGKLKYQIDRLAKAAAAGEDAAQALSRSRPNAMNLMVRGGDSEEEDGSEASESEIESDDGNKTASKSGVYRPPRLEAAPFRDNEKEYERAKEKLSNKRKKLKNSEIMESLREEFSAAPEQSSSTGVGNDSADMKALAEEAEERRKFEEDRFVRLTMSRKDKQAIKRRMAESQQALNNVLDIGDIGEFDELNELSEKYNTTSKFGEVAAPTESKRAKNSSGKDSASALQLAVSAFMDASGSKKKPSLGDDVEDVFADTSKKVKKSAIRQSAAAMEQYSDDDEPYDGRGNNDYDDGSDGNDFDQMLSNGDNDRKRRRAPVDEDGDDGDEDNLLDAFSSRKKEYVQKKKEFYTAAPRYGGMDDTLDEDAKRGVTYEIMANKGLMPHRKKANRNPRVKKREMYAKAVTARKGQVRDVIVGAAGAYGGEKTGIKSNVSRSRKIQT